jgi:hypothetical protein
MGGEDNIICPKTKYKEKTGIIKLGFVDPFAV